MSGNRFPPPPNLPPLEDFSREMLIDTIHRLHGGWAASVVSLNGLADSTERLMESVRRKLEVTPSGGVADE